MTDTILIVGTRALAEALGVGRNQLLAWLADPESKIPASKTTARGSWVATRQNLTDWSNEYFSGRFRPALKAPGDQAAAGVLSGPGRGDRSGGPVACPRNKP